MYTRTSVDDDDGGSVAVVATGDASLRCIVHPLIDWESTGTPYRRGIPLRPSLLRSFNKDGLHDNALVAVERATVDNRVLIFPKKLDGDFRAAVILPFAILQSIVAWIP